MAVVDTRSRILDVALACFLEQGVEQTTVARIRERSGVSNGALFHHFPSKEAIAEALYVDAISSFQEGLWALLQGRPTSMRAAVRGTIHHLLSWVEDHPDLARFVYQRGHLDWDSPGGTEVAALNKDLAAALREWMAPWVARGEIRPTSTLVLSAIVSGPAHAVARRWLTGQVTGSLVRFADELADAAWAGLRGKPVQSHVTPDPPPDRGRITMELVTAEGEVVARGQATVDFQHSER